MWSVGTVESLPSLEEGKFPYSGQGWGGDPLPSRMEVCALVPLSPRPILRTLNVSTDALAANVRGEAGELQVCSREGRNQDVGKARRRQRGRGCRGPVQLIRTQQVCGGGRQQTWGQDHLWDGGSLRSLGRLRRCETQGSLCFTALQTHALSERKGLG